MPNFCYLLPELKWRFLNTKCQHAARDSTLNALLYHVKGNHKPSYWLNANPWPIVSNNAEFQVWGWLHTAGALSDGNTTPQSAVPACLASDFRCGRRSETSGCAEMAPKSGRFRQVCFQPFQTLFRPVRFLFIALCINKFLKLTVGYRILGDFKRFNFYFAGW